MRIIIFGATGMVGEGILLECLHNPEAVKVLSIGRRSSHLRHQKLEELLVNDLDTIAQYKDRLIGYNACFYALGKSSNGMNETNYTKLTYNLTLNIAKVLKEVNPNLVFCFISGAGTDTSENSKVMWARIKGKTENALIDLLGKNAYNFRPALMKPSPEQKNFRGYNRITHKILFPVLKLVFPYTSIKNIARVMIRISKIGYDKQILEVNDINAIILDF
ncbi:NAD-dependent epimerase/dehydratase family protein [Tenacibaculum sp. ZH5_bin.1]|uniref:NAD-dependent epimerase/dehydratase family protein n=1 Tax=Tenacibaculum TaxID=104267 RepID=UPI00143085F1|nr:NAD-dependent epimerase/dehydratase family protein [Tenacibaculum mesophilum]KAF9658496.1 epimerase [Tenacibaculum mesophilum]